MLREVSAVGPPEIELIDAVAMVTAPRLPLAPRLPPLIPP